MHRRGDRCGARGSGGGVVVEGPAGIGKSAVLAAARRSAQDGATRFLRARGAELERDFAFGVVRQLFEPVLHEASPAERDDLLQGPARLAARVLGLPGALQEGEAPAATPDASFTVLHGLYWLCANLAADQLVVLSVDDAHWADTSSLRFLTYLLPRLEELKIALVVATRPEAEGEEAHLLATLTADARAEVLQPAPLSLAAVGRLVHEGLGVAPDPTFTAACHRATGGSPFLVRELVEALGAEGMSPDARTAARVEAVGARTARRWIQLRLGRLPAPAARLARAVAVLERAELPRAAALAELDLAAAAEAADTLVAAGILEPGRPLAFVHPLVRAGVYEELAVAERSLAHRRAAELMDGEPAGEEHAAEHLLATEPAGDRAIARRLVDAARDRGAARRARVRGRPAAPRAGRAAARRRSSRAPARAGGGRGHRGPGGGRGPPAGGARRRRRRPRGGARGDARARARARSRRAPGGRRRRHRPHRRAPARPRRADVGPPGDAGDDGGDVGGRHGAPAAPAPAGHAPPRGRSGRAP